MATVVWINIGLGNILLTNGMEPLPEPVLTNNLFLSEVLWLSCMGNFTGNVQDIYP